MSHSMTLPVPTAIGSVDHYIRAVKAYPILSAEEEHALAIRLQRDNDLDAAKQLIVSHLRLVVSIARGYAGYGLPQADLIQEGNIGLMKAVRRFDPDRGVRLVSFAMHWIKAEINEFVLRNWRMVKVATTKAQRKLFFNLRSMKTHSGGLHTDEIAEIARDLNVKLAWAAAISPWSRTGKMMARKPGARSPIWKTNAPSPRSSWPASRSKSCKRQGWKKHSPAWTSAAVVSSSHAGCKTTVAPRCMNWQLSTASPPSASVRSNRRRCRK